MPRTKENINAHELTGLRVKVLQSPDPTQPGLNGLVNDETKNTMKIQTFKGPRIVPKSGSEFALTLSDGAEVVVPGTHLLYRPEDRVKRGGPACR